MFVLRAPKAGWRLLFLPDVQLRALNPTLVIEPASSGMAWKTPMAQEVQQLREMVESLSKTVASRWQTCTQHISARCCFPRGSWWITGAQCCMGASYLIMSVASPGMSGWISSPTCLPAHP
jgi:TorA maturation chaperone TorD